MSRRRDAWLPAAGPRELATHLTSVYPAGEKKKKLFHPRRKIAPPANKLQVELWGHLAVRG